MADRALVINIRFINQRFGSFSFIKIFQNFEVKYPVHVNKNA